jgi:ribonuclease Z
LSLSLQLTVLGSSGALPAYGRFPSAQLLTIDNRPYLIDCGEGVQMQLAKVGASLHKINHIFISHLHGDHYLGLAGLLFSMHLNKRENDLHLYSFRGLDEILLAQLKYSKSTLNYRLIFHSLTPHLQTVIYEDEQLTVETIPLKHKLDCAGFLFKEKPKPRRIDKEKIFQGMLLQHIALLKTGKDVFNDQGDLYGIRARQSD